MYKNNLHLYLISYISSHSVFDFHIGGSLVGTMPMTFPREKQLFALVQGSRAFWSYSVWMNPPTNEFGLINYQLDLEVDINMRHLI